MVGIAVAMTVYSLPNRGLHQGGGIVLPSVSLTRPCGGSMGVTQGQVKPSERFAELALWAELARSKTRRLDSLAGRGLDLPLAGSLRRIGEPASHRLTTRILVVMAAIAISRSAHPC